MYMFKKKIRQLISEPVLSVRKVFRYTVMQWWFVQLVIKTHDVVFRLKRLGYYKSLRLGRPVTASGEPLPWFSYPALQFLEQLDLSGLKVFEFGSGNSSRYFLRRGCLVTSVEDSAEWFSYLKTHSSENDKMKLIFAATKAEYVSALSGEGTKYDIILVDGSHRELCLEAAQNSLSQRGIIILDNAEWYPESVSKLRGAGFVEIDFCGLGPLNGFGWATSFFFLPSSGLSFSRLKNLSVE